MIDQVDFMKIIENLRGDAVVIPTMRAGIGWAEVSNNPKRDIGVSGAMGKTSSFALGLSLARPNTKIIVYDGDGSLLMNLGTLVTIGNKAPKNLYHFLIDNGVYATTGGQDVPGGGVTDYADMAEAAGYLHSYQFDNLEDFATQAEEVMAQDGPVFVCVKTVPSIRHPHERPATRQAGGATRSFPQAVRELMAELGPSKG